MHMPLVALATLLPWPDPLVVSSGPPAGVGVTRVVGGLAAPPTPVVGKAISSNAYSIEKAIATLLTPTTDQKCCCDLTTVLAPEMEQKSPRDLTMLLTPATKQKTGVKSGVSRFVPLFQINGSQGQQVHVWSAGPRHARNKFQVGESVMESMDESQACCYALLTLPDCFTWQLLDTLPLCRDFRAGLCDRPTCKFVHVSEDVELTEVGRVVVCRDSVRNACKRASCKYYHIPVPLPPST
ncbi:hypothetical protein C0Q70_21192 [Pomacea canaliculata]|uniref:C3H1-type domain-containing protein n=1 Tax=Pomacea canaliculata TaxID=400727 RepID=A0A2T7NBW6_POMCA|nr:hypothetical protein C0Q70_21192 [Pomacea canaliculata]